MKNNKFKNTPFTIPENYFSKLESEIILKSKREKSFTTPDNYFTELENNIIKQTKTKRVNKIFTITAYYKALSIAACTILFISLSFFLLKNNSSKNIASTNLPNQTPQSTTQQNSTALLNNKTEEFALVDTKKQKKNQANTKSSDYKEVTISKSTDIIYDLYFNNESSYDEEEEDSDIIFNL